MNGHIRICDQFWSTMDVNTSDLLQVGKGRHHNRLANKSVKFSWKVARFLLICKSKTGKGHKSCVKILSPDAKFAMHSKPVHPCISSVYVLIFLKLL